jgi:gamma-glutamyl phosphate reductase
MEQYFDETKGDLKYILQEQQKKEVVQNESDINKKERDKAKKSFLNFLKIQLKKIRKMNTQIF